MMNSAQVMNTGGQQQNLSPQEAWWVAGFMIAGVLGLLAIGLIFRKHVEL
jgi:hypothetical protein